MHRVAERLAGARDFVDVAIAVCTVSREIHGSHICGVAMHAPAGRPLVMVDDDSAQPDANRLAFMNEVWRQDQLYLALREKHSIVGEDTVDPERYMRFVRDVGYVGHDVHWIVVPLLYTRGLLGQIRCGYLQAVTAEQERGLASLACSASVRLAELGVTPVPDPSLAALTARQLEVAGLAAGGLTNVEIADKLRLSENTVKKHLKDVFEALAVSNRTELAAHLPRVQPASPYAPGVTRLGQFTVVVASPL